MCTQNHKKPLWASSGELTSTLKRDIKKHNNKKFKNEGLGADSTEGEVGVGKLLQLLSGTLVPTVRMQKLKNQHVWSVTALQQKLLFITQRKTMNASKHILKYCFHTESNDSELCTNKRNIGCLGKSIPLDSDATLLINFFFLSHIINIKCGITVTHTHTFSLSCNFSCL